jgi:hypothetical protein
MKYLDNVPTEIDPTNESLPEIFSKWAKSKTEAINNELSEEQRKLAQDFLLNVFSALATQAYHFTHKQTKKGRILTGLKIDDTTSPLWPLIKRAYTPSEAIQRMMDSGKKIKDAVREEIAGLAKANIQSNVEAILDDLNSRLDTATLVDCIREECELPFVESIFNSKNPSIRLLLLRHQERSRGNALFLLVKEKGSNAEIEMPSGENVLGRIDLRDPGDQKLVLGRLTTYEQTHEEGILQAHCVAGYNIKSRDEKLGTERVHIFSLYEEVPPQEISKIAAISSYFTEKDRDGLQGLNTRRDPIATIEVDAVTARVRQIKFAGNQIIASELDPYFKPLFSALKLLNDYYVKKGRPLRSFSNDLKILEKESQFLTIGDGYKNEDQLQEGDVVVAGSTITPDPNMPDDLLVKKLQLVCSLSNVTLDLKKIQKAGKTHVLNSIHHIRGKVLLDSDDGTLNLQEIFPNVRHLGDLSIGGRGNVSFKSSTLVTVGDISCTFAKTFSLDLPELTRAGNMDGITSASPTSINLPKVAEIGAIYSNGAADFYLNLPSAKRVGNVRANSAKKFHLHLPAATEVGSISAWEANTFALELPSAIEIGHINANGAKDFSIKSPRLKRARNITADKVDTFTLDLREVTWIGDISADEAKKFELLLPRVYSLGKVKATDAVDFRLDLPRAARVGKLYVTSAEKFDVHVPKVVKMGSIHTYRVKIFSLDLPKATDVGSITASGATSVSLNLPNANHVSGVIADYTSALYLDLPKAATIGTISANKATSVYLKMPELTKLKSLDARSAKTMYLDSPKISEIKDANIYSAENIFLNIPHDNYARLLFHKKIEKTPRVYVTGAELNTEVTTEISEFGPIVITKDAMDRLYAETSKAHIPNTM